MSEIVFNNVTFRYPETEKNIFDSFSIELPAGVTSLIGQNGTGKSTFLLLGGGTLLPDEGNVIIQGTDTTLLRDERTRQEYISFIFQNMEFETEENIGILLKFVFENGFHQQKNSGFVDELINVFELEPVIDKKTQEISKGELQRTILAFSLLYGSKILIMDEPVFALEEHRRTNCMNFLYKYAHSNKISILYSVHELDISEKFSDNVLLFFKNKGPELGPANEMLLKEKIEEAYQVPYIMLKKKESLFRNGLIGMNKKKMDR